jgi:hypothetical protein
MLRHACGYKLANESADTRALQLYLGHKDIRHTVRYSLRYEGARQIVKRAPGNSATWGNSEKIYSLGVLPALTHFGSSGADRA